MKYLNETGLAYLWEKIESYVDSHSEGSGDSNKRVVIWQNTSPRNTFSAKTVSLSSNSYDIIEVVFLYDNTETNQHFIGTEVILEKGNTTFAQVIANSTYSNVGYYCRSVKYASDKGSVTFSDCNIKNNIGNTTAGSVNNAYVIPIAIYGYSSDEIITVKSSPWELIANTTNTSSATFDLSSYNEVLVVGDVLRNSAHHLCTAIIPVECLYTTKYELKLTGGNYGSSSANATIGVWYNISKTGGNGVAAYINGTNFISTTTFKVYGRRAGVDNINENTNISETGADYIVEQGVDPIWTWRKWNSGIAECWGRFSLSVSLSRVNNGSIYAGNASQPLPITFIANTTVAHGTSRYDTGHSMAVGIRPNDPITNTLGMQVYDLYARSGTFDFAVEVKGRWK